MIQTILQQYLIPALFIITLAVIVRSRREKVQYIISPLAAIAIGFFCYRYDAARYYIAMFFVILLPPAFSFWFIIHPFIAFWRRVGTTLAYSVAFSLMGIMAVYFERVVFCSKLISARICGR